MVEFSNVFKRKNIKKNSLQLSQNPQVKNPTKYHSCSVNALSRSESCWIQSLSLSTRQENSPWMGRQSIVVLQNITRILCYYAHRDYLESGHLTSVSCQLHFTCFYSFSYPSINYVMSLLIVSFLSPFSIDTIKPSWANER